MRPDAHGIHLAESRHATTRAALEAHRPADAQETDDLALMRRVLATVPAPFSRRTFPHHFTASALIVSPRGDQVLLVHHRRLDRWLQPGGHFEPTDPDPWTAAIREAREETGVAVRPHPDGNGLLDVDVHPIPGRADEPDHYHLDLRFLFLADPTDAIDAHAGETKAARWCDWDHADGLPGAGRSARMFGKARRTP